MSASFPSAYLFKAVDPKTTAEKRRRGRCICFGCRRRADKRSRKLRCHTCISRLKRLRHDDRYAYENLQRSAKIRRIPFKLSFVEFKDFCAKTDYLAKRGQWPEDLTIDRIKTDRPYQADNLRILTNADNASHKYEEFADRCRRRGSYRSVGAA